MYDSTRKTLCSLILDNPDVIAKIDPFKVSKNRIGRLTMELFKARKDREKVYNIIYGTNISKPLTTTMINKILLAVTTTLEGGEMYLFSDEDKDIAPGMGNVPVVEVKERKNPLDDKDSFESKILKIYKDSPKVVEFVIDNGIDQITDTIRSNYNEFINDNIDGFATQLHNNKYISKKVYLKLSENKKYITSIKKCYAEILDKSFNLFKLFPLECRVAVVRRLYANNKDKEINMIMAKNTTYGNIVLRSIPLTEAGAEYIVTRLNNSTAINTCCQVFSKICNIIEDGNIDNLEMLYRAGWRPSMHNSVYLRRAALNREGIEVFKWMMDHGANISIDMWVTLGNVVSAGNFELTKYIADTYEDIIDISVADYYCLRRASISKSVECRDYLANKFNVNSKYYILRG